MSSAYLNKSTKSMTTENLRSIYFGSSQITPPKESLKMESKKQKIRDKIMEEEGTLPNPFGWELEYVEQTLSKHVKLTATLLGEMVEVRVYPYAMEKGLKPHLDIHIPSQRDIHLTPEMLIDLSRVVQEAKKILNGEISDYFPNITIE